MFRRLTIAQRLWAPTLGLAAMLVLAGSLTAVRTQSLIAQAHQAQSAQLEKLELALLWRGSAAGNGAPSAAFEQKLRAHAPSTAELKLFDAVGAAADAPAREAALDAVVKQQREQAQALQAQAAEQRMRTVWGVMALMAVIISIVALSSVFLVRTVCRPLLALRNLADRIGHGDLSVAVDTTRSDEIGDLQRSIADMRDALRRLVGSVQQSAEQIRLASSEVAAGNADLSSRTEGTAARLQQTAGSMAQITGQVQRSSDAATQAHGLAGTAAEVAARGGALVGEVVQTMEQIQSGSRRIADITGVIDGIAFQTNILALNAAVEAARAGEQGRGFAVVAGEVRSLAQRSAAAAREIKVLIGTSSSGVEQGSRQVAHAGSTMAEIVASVQRVCDIVGGISNEASAQSTSLAQVNGAVVQLDQMTQQNAALVEQSFAAAESLKEQARTLADAVSSFRLAPAA
jgi:methyl-accepting chemotaxis protein